MSTNDRELVAGLKSGDMNAFRTLYELNGPAMLSMALRVLGRLADAEDAVQEAFLTIFRGIRAFESRSSLSTWVYRITVNSCLKQLRDRKRTIQDELDGMTHQEPHDPALTEAEAALARAVAELPERQRLTFTLHQIEGLKLVQVAEVLEIKATTARFHLLQARRQLRRRLHPYLTPSEAESTVPPGADA